HQERADDHERREEGTQYAELGAERSALRPPREGVAPGHGLRAVTAGASARATGILKSSVVVCPAATVICLTIGLTRSCQPTTLYSPGGTASITKCPSASGRAKKRFGSTSTIALMSEWMWQNTCTVPVFSN